MQTADQVAQKWQQRLSLATEAIKQGVQGVQTSPMEKAAANQQGYIQGVTQAATSGKWARGLRRRTLQDWQQSMISKGLPRIAQGASAAQPKMQAFMQQWLPYQQQLQQLLSTMPRGSLEANKARAMAAIDFNSKFQRQ